MKNKKLDIFGLLCGVFLLVVLVANIVLGNANARANQPKIPATAQTFTTSAKGIFSEVKLETVADADGIYSVKVVEHGETPELGGVAAEELPGKILEAQSVDVDGVAGATMTSNAIKAAVTEALVEAGFMEAPAVEEPVEEEPAAEEPETVEAAAGAGESYSVSAPGVFGEPVEVEVVADANTIYSVTVTKHNETEGIGSIAAAELPGKIVEAQSVEVDGVAGATMTSNAIKKAVAEALEQAGFGGTAAEEPAVEEPAEEPAAEEPETVEAAGAGETYTVSAPGVFGEPVEVEVVADANTIYSVTVTKHNETEGIGSVAAAQLPDKIVEAQSVEVDGVAGATMTSNAIKKAVAEALEQAGFGGTAAEEPVEEPAAEEPAVEEPAEEPAAEEPETVEAAAVEGGTYTVSAPGVFGEPVEVKVVADANTIYSVTVTKHNETEGIGSVAAAQLPDKIVEAQSADVDGMAGATMTSNAIKKAVAEALEQAGFVGAAAADGPQTLTASAPGVFGEPVEVEVVADAKGIYSVTVTKHNETEGIGSVAAAQLPGKIVEAQSADVDGISGATMTSNAIKTAVAAALEAAGIDPAGFAAAGAETVEAAAVEKTPVTLECDVVVVGAGGAGLTSAVRATQEGAKVLVLEKMPVVGGNSLRAEGGMNAAETKVQEALGITDSTVEGFIEDTLRLGHDLADPALVRTLSENSAEAVEWLETIGAPLTKVAATGGTSHKYLHKPEDGRPVGEYLVKKLSETADELGIEIRVNTKATEILMEDGRAVGVTAEDAEHIYTVCAKAVVLATGGFGSNFELMASYDPSLADAVTTNHSGATGDGIAMAEAVGAATVDMEQIQLHPTVIQSNGLLVSESVRSHGAILVNAEGKRFVNDMAGRDVVSQAELKQPGAYAFIIFDQNLVDEVALTQKFIAGGYAVQGESYEALAEAMGLEGEAVKNFVETMETWNAAVAAGEDKEFGRDNGMDVDLSTAPYYAIKIAPGIHHTMGGIKIDTKAEVVSTEGEVIPGLFACGETTGGIHGGNRVGGNAVCDFIVFGRIAGQSAAAYASGEPVDAEEAAEEPETEAESGLIDGEYTAAAESQLNWENVYVTIVVEDGKIVSADVDTSSQSADIGAAAEPEYEEQILAAQGGKIDGVAGATITSIAVKEAYAEVLKQAETAAEEPAATPEEAIAEEPAPAEEESVAEASAEDVPAEAEPQGVIDGEYTAAAESQLNWENVYVTIVVEGGKIVSVDVDTSSQSSDIGAAAEPQYEELILAAQGGKIDNVSGATITSIAVKEAYADVLKQAGFTG